MSDNANLYQCLAAGFRPDARAFELPDGSVFTYADVEAQTARAAVVLSELGLERGDRVSVVAEKSLAYVWLYLGCLRAGCVFHPLNPAYTGKELEFFLGDAGTRLLVYDPERANRVEPAADACRGIEYRLSLAADGSGEFACLCAAAATEFSTVESSADDSAALLYSSGTTGTPKGICITHGNLYRNAVALADAWAFSAADTLLHVLPIYHVHGLFITLGPALLAGCCVRLRPRFDAEETIAALPGATMFAGVPTYYSRLLANANFTRDVCATVRVFISGSAPLSESTFHDFEARTGHTILERYGMTETGINTSNPLLGHRKAGSVGPPLAGVELRVVDEQGRETPAGAVGAIEVRGENVFPGYWGLPEASASAFDADRWFDTGDQGYLDEDNYLFIVGRSKDMIISGGLNVYPKEIEREVERLDGIAEAAVFGVAHADFGEAVVAAIVPLDGQEPDEAQTINALKKNLAGFKVPKRILMVGDLPRNAMGKVQKNKLRERYNGLFSSGS